MDLIEIFLIVFIAAAAVFGYFTGFISKIGTFAAVVAGIVLCRLIGPPLADAIAPAYSADADINRAIIYSIIFIVVYVAVIIIARLSKKLITAMSLGIVDRIAGAVFGVFEWLVLLSFVLNVYFIISPRDRDRLCQPSKPWREAVIDLAPALGGYLDDIKH